MNPISTTGPGLVGAFSTMGPSRIIQSGSVVLVAPTVTLSLTANGDNSGSTPTQVTLTLTNVGSIAPSQFPIVVTISGWTGGNITGATPLVLSRNYVAAGAVTITPTCTPAAGPAAVLTPDHVSATVVNAGVLSAATSTDGLTIIFTNGVVCNFSGAGGITVKKNGSTWATDADISGFTGIGTTTLGITFAVSPLISTDTVTVTMGDGEFTFDSSGENVPGVTNLAVTNNASWSPAVLGGALIAAPIAQDAKAAGKLWVDTISGTPASANSDVAVMQDPWVSGLNWSANDASNNFKLIDEGGGKWTLLCNNNANSQTAAFLSSVAPVLASGQGSIYLAVAYVSGLIVGHNQGFPVGYVLYYNASPAFVFLQSDAAVSTSVGALTQLAAGSYVLRFRRDGSDHWWFSVNGGTETDCGAAAGAFTIYSIWKGNPQYNEPNLRVAGSMVVSGAVSAGNNTQILNYLTARLPSVLLFLAGLLAYWGPGQKYADAAGTVPQTSASGNVKAWRDYFDPAGGYMLSESSTPPTLDSNGGVVFGSGKQLVMPAGPWGAVKTMIVVYASSTDGALITDSGGNASHLNVFTHNLDIDIYAGGNITQSNNFTPSTSRQMYAMVFSDTTDQIYELTKEVESYQHQGSTGGATRSSTAIVGTGFGASLTGPIYAMAMFSTELTAAQIQLAMWQINRDLTEASGLGPQVILNGNSLTAGADFPDPADRYPNKVGALEPTWNVVNAGIGGIKTPELSTGNTGIAAHLIPLFDPLRQNLTAMLEITNDYNGGTSAADAYQNVVDYHTLLRTWGPIFTSVSCTVPQNLTDESDRQTINGNILANWPAWSDGVIDFGSAPHIGTGNYLTDPTYWSGSLHPSALGNGVMSPLNVATVQPLVR